MYPHMGHKIECTKIINGEKETKNSVQSCLLVTIASPHNVSQKLGKDGHSFALHGWGVALQKLEVEGL